MVLSPEMVRQVILREDLKSTGPISRKNGARYGDGPGAAQVGPFPEEYVLTYR
jgi:hypothetical protein